MAQRADWNAMKEAFVEGWTNESGRHVWPQQSEIAARFSIDKANLSKRASREGWAEQRAAFQRRLDEQRFQERATEIARIAADLDIEAVRAAQQGMVIARIRLSELFNRSQRRLDALNRDDVKALDRNPPVDALEMDRLARTADAWYVLGTRAIGLGPRTEIEIELVQPTDQERDARTMRTLALLKEHAPELLPPGFEDVIDVDSELRVLTGVGEGGTGSDVDAPHEQVHPTDADHRQPQR